MPRGSRSSSGGGRSARAAPPKRPPPRPTPVNHPPPPPPPPAPRQYSSGGTFSGTMAEGVAFGAGASVGHRAVDAVFGPPTIRHETVVTGSPAASPAPAPAPNSNGLGSDACDFHSKAFLDCINSNVNEVSKCQIYMNMLVECRRNSGDTLSA